MSAERKLLLETWKSISKNVLKEKLNVTRLAATFREFLRIFNIMCLKLTKMISLLNMINKKNKTKKKAKEELQYKQIMLTE